MARTQTHIRRTDTDEVQVTFMGWADDRGQEAVVPAFAIHARTKGPHLLSYTDDDLIYVGPCRAELIACLMRSVTDLAREVAHASWGITEVMPQAHFAWEAEPADGGFCEVRSYLLLRLEGTDAALLVPKVGEFTAEVSLVRGDHHERLLRRGFCMK